MMKLKKQTGFVLFLAQTQSFDEQAGLCLLPVDGCDGGEVGEREGNKRTKMVGVGISEGWAGVNQVGSAGTVPDLSS